MSDLLIFFDGGTLSQFHFMRPWWLIAFFPMMGLYYILKKQDDVMSQWEGVMAKNVLEHLTINRSAHRFVTPNQLFVLFSILATLVMAGPSWKQQLSPFYEDDSQLIIALDVSTSMKTADIEPTRLARAKHKIAQLIQQRGGGKTGLIIFGGSAHVAMPVTTDGDLTRYFLDVLDDSLLPNKESHPEVVISPIVELLNQAKSPSSVLLVTDKTNTLAIEKLEDEFRSLEHQVIVWAMRESVQSGNSSFPENTPKSSQMQIKNLSKLAEAGHGELVMFTRNGDDVAQVQSLVKSNLFAVSDEQRPWLDAGYLLLFILLPVQLMWFRRGWTLQW